MNKRREFIKASFRTEPWDLRLDSVAATNGLEREDAETDSNLRCRIDVVIANRKISELMKGTNKLEAEIRAELLELLQSNTKVPPCDDPIGALINFANKNKAIKDRT